VHAAAKNGVELYRDGDTTADDDLSPTTTTTVTYPSRVGELRLYLSPYNHLPVCVIRDLLVALSFNLVAVLRSRMMECSSVD
jgi:hypothetical protein